MWTTGFNPFLCCRTAPAATGPLPAPGPRSPCNKQREMHVSSRPSCLHRAGLHPASFPLLPRRMKWLKVPAPSRARLLGAPAWTPARPRQAALSWVCLARAQWLPGGPRDSVPPAPRPSRHQSGRWEALFESKHKQRTNAAGSRCWPRWAFVFLRGSGSPGPTAPPVTWLPPLLPLPAPSSLGPRSHPAPTLGLPPPLLLPPEGPGPPFRSSLPAGKLPGKSAHGHRAPWGSCILGPLGPRVSLTVGPAHLTASRVAPSISDGEVGTGQVENPLAQTPCQV